MPIPEKPNVRTLPPAPQRSQMPLDYAQTADVWAAAWQGFSTEISALGSWMDGIGLLVMQYAQDTEAWRNQTESMRNEAKVSETNAKASETAAKQHLDDTRELIQNFDPVGNLPDETIKNAPLVVSTEQGGVRFSDRALNNGVNVRPVLRLDFQNQKRLDPRVTFSRASVDWDENGREYGIDEPVLTDKGLWVSGARTNLFYQSRDLTQLPWRALVSIRKLPGLKSPIGTDVFSVDRDGGANSYVYQPVTIEKGVDYTLSCLVQFKSGDEEYRLFMAKAAFDGGGSSAFTLGEDGGLVATSNGKYKELGGGWFLVWRTGKGKENVTGNHIQFHAYPNDPLVDNFMSAPQFEAGVVPTAFIPTESSQVTVARAEVEVPGSILAPFSAGGTFFASGIIPHYSDYNTMVGIGSSNPNELRIGYTSPASIGAVFKSGTTERSATIPVEAVGVGEVIKVAFSYSLSFNGEVEFRTCINGELQGVRNLPALPSGFPNLGMAIGRRRIGSSALYWGEKIFGVSYYDKPLSDGQLINLTTRESA